MSVKLSIVIPCYNSAKFINNTIDSIINQSNNNFEVIFIDDGSTDNTVSIINSKLYKKNILYKVISQSNSGVSAARNKGIDNSKGEYICFLDSDDTIRENFVDKMIKKVEFKNSDLVFGGFNFVNNNGDLLKLYTDKYKYIHKIESGKQIVKLMLREKIWICIGNAIYKKDIIDKYNIKFTIGCFNGEDQEFIYKFLSHSNEIDCVNEVLMNYYQREDSMVHSVSLKKFTVLGAIKRVIKYYEKLGIDQDIIEYLKYNKYQKEYLRNMLSMINEAHNYDILLRMIYNKKFNKNIKKFKILKMENTPHLSIREIAFIIKIWIYIYIPNFYNKKLKKFYQVR